MKLKLLFLSLFSVAVTTAHATKLTITVRDFQFTPADATLNLGDTIVFTWINGTHTTTSTTIPAAASTWDRPMTNTNPSFTYVPSVAGVYNYKCTPHEAMGHIGKFTVNNTTSISGYDLTKVIFDVYPNPAQSLLNISVANNQKVSSLTVTDITGKQLISQPEVKTGTFALNINALSNGIYFVRLVRDGQIYVRKFTVAK